MSLTLENSDYPWLAGRVPNGFWDVREHRVRYMDWLARLCNFKNPEDWYAARKSQFKGNRGGGLLSTRYRDSIYIALQDYCPDYEWLPWKFRRAPNNFWSSIQNRRRYMNWLHAELKFRSYEQWYGVTKKTFKKHFGAGLLYGWYGDSVLAAVKEYQPGYEWHPWLFNESPNRFWHDAENRRAYMSWLGKKLSFDRPEDWFAVTTKSFVENRGSGFLSFYGDSPQQAVREYLPGLASNPWLFTSVPQQYWQDADNRMCYLKWLGQQLGFQNPTDWFRLSSTDFRANRGRGLLDFYASQAIGKAIAEALRESGNRKVIVWPVIQLIECSSTNRDPQTLFLALGS